MFTVTHFSTKYRLHKILHKLPYKNEFSHSNSLTNGPIDVKVSLNIFLA